MFVPAPSLPPATTPKDAPHGPARAEGLAGRVVTLKLRTPDFRIHTRRRTIPVPTQTAKTLFSVGRDLLAREATGKSYRLIGIGLAELIEAEAVEDDFFAGDERRALAGEKTLDAIRARFEAIAAARRLGPYGNPVRLRWANTVSLGAVTIRPFQMGWVCISNRLAAIRRVARRSIEWPNARWVIRTRAFARRSSPRQSPRHRSPRCIGC